MKSSVGFPKSSHIEMCPHPPSMSPLRWTHQPGPAGDFTASRVSEVSVADSYGQKDDDRQLHEQIRQVAGWVGDNKGKYSQM